MKAALVLIALTIGDLSAQVQLSPLVPGPQQQTGNFSAIPGPAQQQTGNASIEGTVVDALTHEPVKKASVMLGGRVNLTAVTDASGHFAFRLLTAGTYSVQAQSDRYPLGRFGESARQTSVTIAADEQKRDVTLSLTPGASVRGRILDEEGSPMAQCMVSAMQRTTTERSNGLVNAGGGAQSDENGEYRIANLPAGKYYLLANCPQTIPLPHAFIRRGSADDLPRLVYRNLFYPGTSDPTGAARIEAQPGGVVASVDFRMVPASGVTLRGRIRPSSFEGNSQVNLQPSDPLRRWAGQLGGRVNPSTGEFQFPYVQPGSYELEAFAMAGKQSYFARVPVEVGASAPDPIELLLSPSAQISGTLVIEADDKQPPNPNPVRIMLNPLLSQMFFGPSPQAEVKSDGTFVFESVIPGRWRINVSGPGYVKSLVLGDQQVSGDEIEITAAAQLKVVMGTKFVQVTVSVSLPPASAGALTAIAWTDASSVQQNAPFDSQNNANFSVPPGRYHVCGLAAAQPWMILQNRAFRKALESHCETVDIVEGGQQKVQISTISSEEVKRIADSLDE